MRDSDPPVQYLVGTPKGRLTRLEKQLAGQALAQARAGVKVKLLAQRQRALCAGREPRSGRQGARDAPAPTEVAVGAAQATQRHEAHARGFAHEARRGKTDSPQRLAPDRHRGGQTRRLIHLSLPQQEAASERGGAKVAICCAPI